MASSGRAAASTGADKKLGKPEPEANEKETESQRKARVSLIQFLTRKYDEVRPELARPKIIQSMMNHRSQAIDKEDKAHGHGKPKYRLTYDPDQDRLKLEA